MTIEPYVIIAFLVGCIYAALIHFANWRWAKATEGVIWLEVVVGVGITGLVIWWLIGWVFTIGQAFIALSATGSPMVIGSLIRYGYAQEQQRRRGEETVAKG